MTTPPGARRLCWSVGLVAALALTGCSEKPVIANAGEEASVGGMTFALGNYSARYLELVEGSQTYEYPRPVLVIPVTITNSGEGEFAYNPTHSSQQMSEAATPLLFPDPGPEADLATAPRAPISGVFLQQGSLPEQITERRSLSPGQSINDVFLFELPDGPQKLVLSIPPAMHRGNLPLFFRFDYTPRAPEGPRVYEVGERAEIGRAAFTVDKVSIAYLKLEDTAQGEGFSTEALFRIDYTVSNTSGDPLEYNPGHRDLTGRGAALFSSSRGYRRVRFPATTTPVGQTQGSATIQPGESRKDYVIFEVPGEGIEAVTFEFPAPSFSEAGLVRVNIPFERTIPDPPAEMKSRR
jgi:hypothetical protein